MTIPALDHSMTGYSLPHAYWMARAAGLASLDRDGIEAQAHAWGFGQVRYFESTHKMPFPIEDTQAYVMASDRMIVTGFRGTEVAKIRDWLTDVDTPPVPGPAGRGFVHYGFHQALQSVYPQVRETILELRTEGQSVWFTGHSLGAALAMLAGARLYFEEPGLLADGVYTFGQPRTCERLLAGAHNKAFADRCYRFVNNNDIVPQLPPEPVYTHVDALRYFDADGRLHEAMPLMAKLRDRAKGLGADLFAPETDAVKDHHLPNYLAALEKNLTKAG
ncbi:lipase family protein [Streptomyces sp. SL13]|uniref:Lipase family protein n=1 Tax=Streptantibioticus silvisoli TaxID=2705255 RepID=A0AA90GYM4_9ACTN|nr:lipase family protein [Streptantibioticus silvisoli]MDI5961904.1 lipase family protein [Streptantibioticus silvisoli]MDI5967981.1 lipase family protein [Streptantibioticus silvisoli]